MALPEPRRGRQAEKTANRRSSQAAAPVAGRSRSEIDALAVKAACNITPRADEADFFICRDAAAQADEVGPAVLRDFVKGRAAHQNSRWRGHAPVGLSPSLRPTSRGPHRRDSPFGPRLPSTASVAISKTYGLHERFRPHLKFSNLQISNLQSEPPMPLTTDRNTYQRDGIDFPVPVGGGQCP